MFVIELIYKAGLNQIDAHMRAHMRFFINGEQVFDMKHPLRQTDDIQIVQALSGG